MKERLLYVEKNGKFEPTERPTRSFKKVCKQFTQAMLKQIHPVSKLTDEDFIGAYEGRRKTVYSNALTSLLYKPFRKSDSYINFFVKCEKINFTRKPNSAPRGISPRNPRYHVMLGPYIKRIEKQIYKSIGRVFGAVTVFKGLNAKDRGRYMRSHWESFNDPVAIGLDASRFDQHVSKPALLYEHYIYKRFYPNNKEFSHLLSLQLNNKLFYNAPDGKVKLDLEGGRMSGDMNTALGNCLLMSGMVYSYLSEQKIRKFRLANDGDDCVVFVERKDLKKLNNLQEWFLRLGFDMKREATVDIFEQIEFCQSQPIWTEDGWLMVRKVADSIPKDSISIKPLTTKGVFEKWMSAVGQGGLALTGGIPVLQEIYSCYTRAGKSAPPLVDPTLESGMMRLARGMKRQYQTIHPETRLSFWRAFGITISMQIGLEEHFRELNLEYTTPSSVCDLPYIR